MREKPPYISLVIYAAATAVVLLTAFFMPDSIVHWPTFTFVSAGIAFVFGFKWKETRVTINRNGSGTTSQE